MNTFRYNLGSDCPICHGARKDCRQSSMGLIHCRSGENPPPGWRFIKEDEIGFGIYAAGMEQFSQADLEHYQRESAQRKAANLEVAKSLLPNDQRDRQYRRIARAQGLSLKHRTNLEQRGLLPQEIDFAVDQGWISTWQPWERIGAASPALAGVDPETGNLCGIPGIAIYAQTFDGHLVGAQIGADDRNKFGKYPWLSSQKRGGQLAKTAKQ